MMIKTRNITFLERVRKRSDKIPFYTSYYGLGTIVKTKIASKGLLISEKKWTF